MGELVFAVFITISIDDVRRDHCKEVLEAYFVVLLYGLHKGLVLCRGGSFCFGQLWWSLSFLLYRWQMSSVKVVGK
jgi:hypothetical protein